MRILLVEDEPEMAAVLSRALAQEAMIVDLAPTKVLASTSIARATTVWLPGTGVIISA